MSFEPVSTAADLATLDETEIVEGYMSADRGDPEPGGNRGRAYWHGWRMRMMDLGELPHDAETRLLVKELFPHFSSDPKNEKRISLSGRPK